jgi:sugar-specific transcriptional regulator TrmB
VSYERVGASPKDVEFRKVVKSVINSATREIVVVAGELGSYGFPELKEAAIAALKRGVRVRVYATTAAPVDVIDEIRKLGGEIYIGQIRVKDHYLMADRRMLIVSEKEQVGKPTEIGTRTARVYDDPEKATEVVEFLDDLIRSDFMDKATKESRSGAFVSSILRAFVPSYAQPVKEPRRDD